MDWFSSKTDEDALQSSDRLSKHFPEGPLAQAYAIDIVASTNTVNDGPESWDSHFLDDCTNYPSIPTVLARDQLNQFCIGLWNGTLTIRHSTPSFDYLDLSVHKKGLELLLDDPPSIILIRKEYRDIYEMLLDQSTGPDSVPAWVITGQPGIGLYTMLCIKCLLLMVKPREDIVFILCSF